MDKAEIQNLLKDRDCDNCRSNFANKCLNEIRPEKKLPKINICPYWTDPNNGFMSVGMIKKKDLSDFLWNGKDFYIDHECEIEGIEVWGPGPKTLFQYRFPQTYYFPPKGGTLKVKVDFTDELIKDFIDNF